MPVSTSPVEDALAVDPGGNAPPGRRWKPRSGGLIALPALLLIAVCFVLPVGNILRLSFMEPVAGFGNYAHLATESLYGRIALTTLRISVLTTIIVVALGYLVAYVIAQAGPRLRSWLLLIVLVPFWMSVLVRAFAWILLLQREGLLNSALLSLGLIQQPLSLLRNETGVLIGMVHYMIPYATLPLLSSMLAIDPRLMAAARACGAGPVRTMWRIFLPLSLPGLAGATILVFVLNLGFLVTPALLGGGKVLMVAQYIQFGINETLNWGIATALATSLLALVLISLVVASRFIRTDTLFGAP